MPDAAKLRGYGSGGSGLSGAGALTATLSMVPMHPLVIVALLVLQARQAPPSDLPAPVTAGLEALEAGRCDEAFKHWSSRSTASTAGTNAIQRLTDCASLRRLGALHGHELLRVVGVGTRIRRVYLMLRYDAQPVYLLLLAYQPADEWSIIKVNWNTNADRVLPPTMVPPERAEP
jgi:hypothetical protein